MAEKNPTMKILTIIIIAALIISVGILIYTNIPKPTDQGTNGPPSGNETRTPILTVVFDGVQKNYTLQEIQGIIPYKGRGGYRTSFPSIKGIGNYTGVPITALIQETNISIENYSIIVYSSDNSSITYNYSQILGNVDRYNPDNASDPTPIGHGGLSMVLCYQYEGNLLNVSKDGTLKIAFLDQSGSITKSSLWWKYVISITIVPEIVP